MSVNLQSDLDTILTVLGTTKPSLWPFVEGTGLVISGIAVVDLASAESSGTAEALEDDFSPLKHPSGLHSYHFNPTGDHHLAGLAHANFTFGDGSDDAAFSVGAWIRPVVGNVNVIMGKYDSAGNKEEWRFFIDSNGKLSLELHDASASATEIGVSTDDVTLGAMQFCVATYDGTNATPDVKLYINGVQNGAGTTAETGSYVAMEDTNAPLTVGCSGVTATPVAEFHGRIALPFVTGKELSGENVVTLYNIGKDLLGI